MKQNKLFIIIAAMVALLFCAGQAFAADRVEVKVVSEPIAYHAACDKGGGFSLEWDSGSTLADGDVITIDLPTNPATGERVTLCNSFDIEISPAGVNSFFNGAAPGNIQTAAAPFIDPTGASTVAAGNGIFFRIVGVAGAQRVTVYILGDPTGVGGDILQVGAAPNDKVILYFMDQRINGAPYVPPGEGVWLYGTATPATIAANTLCINVTQWESGVVLVNMDSAADKFTFIPSNPQIAHIGAAVPYAWATCKGAIVGNIIIGGRVVQGMDTCVAFDFETHAGYCANHFGATRAIIQGLTGPFPLANYQVMLQILVNGATTAKGVFWSNEVVNADGYDDLNTVCAAAAPLVMPVGAQPNYQYWEANGITAVAPGNVEAPHANVCDVGLAARATILKTDQSTLSIAGTNDFLWVDMPALNYDLDEIAAGDVVTIRVTVLRYPCGTLFTGDIMIGTFGCALAPITTGLLYPYFTEADSAKWWNGVAIDNLGAVANGFTIYIYENDGDQGTYTHVSLAGRHQFVDLWSNIIPLAVQTAGTGTLGDSTFYAVACCLFNAHGFAMIGDQITGEALGYLPVIVAPCPIP
jgi:hypothetical protein